MKTSIKTVGVLSLLFSAAGMASTVEVRPIQSATPLAQSGTCVLSGGLCDATYTTNNFQIVVMGLSQPLTTGATLGLAFSGNAMTLTNAQLSTVAPSSGQLFNAIVATPDPTSNTLTNGSCVNLGDCIITVLAPTAGTLPSGTVPAMVLSFTTSCASICNYNISILDDGGDFSWSATDASSIPNTYTQAHVRIIATPVPAALWLLVSGLGSLVGLKRFRRS